MEPTDAPKPKQKSLAQEIFSLCLKILIFFVLILTFIGDRFHVPSESMEVTLKPGDLIWVNKLAYGARIPFFERLRLPGFTHIKRNDVVVFNMPSETGPIYAKDNYVKRCIGLPGDTISIADRAVSVNGKPLADANGVVFPYRVEATIDTLDAYLGHTMGLTESESRTTARQYNYLLTGEQVESIKKLPFVTSVKAVSVTEAGNNMFPGGSRFVWTKDNYGPIVVPGKGMTIHLCQDSIQLYEKIISDYEHHKLANRNDSIFIDDKYAMNYTFAMNYYFMLGDNRVISEDSRYWGFVPENHIIGRASFVIFSVRPHPKSESFWKRINSSRWFKSIE